MRRTLIGMLALAALFLGAGGGIFTVAQADVRPGANKERRFWSAREGITVEAPPGWSLSMHTGYANVLCSFLHPGGGRISLAVDRTGAKDAASLAAESRPGLTAQGLTIDRVSPGPKGGVLVDARLARRNQAVRQLYIVRELEGPPPTRQAIVLTLATAIDQLPAAGSAFDWLLARLSLEAPLRAETKADGGR
jgi:hypothetical protein